jgi:hypothetical protein
MVIADTIFESTGISWQPVVSYESAELAVSGPGVFSFRREFSANEALVFLVNDRNLPALEDGQYAWELRFSPVTDAEVKEALRAARESGDSREIETLKREGKLPSEPLVISGYFRVKGGWIIADETEAGFRRTERRGRPAGTTTGVVDTDPGAPIAKDQVILDDLIVDGSICAGMDCVNGESFGFDTIRLKENNLRIRFVDTSSTSSFPSRDWQITVNDSANGGASKFSIDDIDGGRTPFTIEAGAPSHSLYVDDGGRIGFGTSTPVVDLHVRSGNTPTLRLEQDGSSGFTPQTWDVAGNEANFFIRDATNGSQLPFRIIPGADSNSVYIDSNNFVGFGTSSPEATLHVVDNLSEALDYIMLVENTTTGSGSARLALRTTKVSPTSTEDPTWIFNSNGSLRLSAGSDAAEFVLDAAGHLKVTGSYTVNTTTLNVPDYVFEPDYDLMPLDELRSFLLEHRRLPNVPSAESVSKDGLNMTEMQLRLLEKIEELTLYTLQQQAIIDELREKISSLEHMGRQPGESKQ